MMFAMSLKPEIHQIFLSPHVFTSLKYFIE